MNWYLQTSKDSDVVKSTRINFKRNIKNYKFHLDDLELKELEKKIEDNIYAIGYGLKLNF